jgi:hypothetical protein
VRGGGWGVLQFILPITDNTPVLHPSLHSGVSLNSYPPIMSMPDNSGIIAVPELAYHPSLVPLNVAAKFASFLNRLPST